ncbi:ParB N-terminal domain-containing protein [Acetatifactor muris]|uniref:Chromosome-partitioning protein Spo0J n=1 Tax=Acetatifactor muris TaxID=879566 RepID=A0A2K4ZKD4_9FIRM|nr:ParB N-terminal domain-containing protein [Acetatifactor muris]MCR2049136.1 ParB N-terminal domain-containing protein [Acetatifactor muris]MCX4304849.1 ParB N-terminal domain-containing protein [Acetatifactor sp.]SOY30943.1 Chromosome-partitioning protein Spo0J [Acetatifactor muris]
MDREIRELEFEDIVPFKHHSGRTYDGARLQQLMDSIEHVGLIDPIIVRSADSGKYEIICGHNRAKAVKALGHGTIRAEIRYGISDKEALEMFYDSNLNRHSFSDWNYAQKFEAVKYIEDLIKKTSCQGKRNDLEKEKCIGTEDGTCVQTRHKSPENSRRSTVRDKMSKRLGISTATLSKYRRIIKLPNNLLQSIAQLLDEKRITFEAAYTISNMRNQDIIWLLEELTRHPDRIPDLKKLSGLPHRNDKKPSEIYSVSKKKVLAALVSPPSSGIITPVRRRRS